MTMKETLTITLDSVRHEDQNGFLHVANSHITKATVNPYYGREIPDWQSHGLAPDRIYYALRDPDELRKSLPTWAGLPLQFEHHEEGATEDGAKETRCGTVGTEIRWNAPYIDAPLTIWEQKAIDAVKDGTCREISCAYTYDPDFISGTFEGQPYDFVMRNIRGNHVALVPEGRAGHDVLVADANLSTNQEDRNMPKKMAKDDNPEIETKEVEIGKAVEAAGEALQALHTEGAEGAPVDKPEAPAETADGSLEEIKAKYKLDDAALAEIREALAGAATDEEPCTDKETCDEEPEKKAEDEEAEKASDEEPEKAADEDETDKAADTEELIKKAEDRALKRAVAYMTQLNASKAKAAEKVAPVVGRLNPMTFDSANGIYAHALKKLGVNVSAFKPSQYEAVLSGYMAAKFPSVKRTAMASDAKGPTYAFEKNLSNIRIED